MRDALAGLRIALEGSLKGTRNGSLEGTLKDIRCEVPEKRVRTISTDAGSEFGLQP